VPGPPDSNATCAPEPELLWPGLRRRALDATFELIAWRARTSQVIVKLRPEAADDGNENEEGAPLGDRGRDGPRPSAWAAPRPDPSGRC
jgi:hypothetical protein